VVGLPYLPKLIIWDFDAIVFVHECAVAVRDGGRELTVGDGLVIRWDSTRMERDEVRQFFWLAGHRRIVHFGVPYAHSLRRRWRGLRFCADWTVNCSAGRMVDSVR